jgi:hypothetical protein
LKELAKIAVNKKEMGLDDVYENYASLANVTIVLKAPPHKPRILLR